MTKTKKAQKIKVELTVDQLSNLTFHLLMRMSQISDTEPGGLHDEDSLRLQWTETKELIELFQAKFGELRAKEEK